MNSNHFLFWWRWLVVVTVCAMLLGSGMVLLPDAASSAFAWLFFASPDYFVTLGPSAATYVQFSHGVIGAVLIGWGMALLLVLLGPFRNGSREAWRTLVFSVLAWFLPDTALSLWWGFWQNAVLNLGLAVMFAIPLAFTCRRSMEKRGVSTRP